MAVHGDQSLTVIQENGLAVVVQVIHKCHLGIGWCANFGTGRRSDVQAAVGIARLAIKKPAMTKQAAHRAFKGTKKAVLWWRSVRERQIQGALATALSPDTRQLFRIRINHLAVFQRDVLF